MLAGSNSAEYPLNKTVIGSIRNLHCTACALDSQQPDTVNKAASIVPLSNMGH